MAWNLSTGAKIALLSAQPSVQVFKMADTISFGDGDGTGSTDTINDSGSGLGSFDVNDHVLIISSDANHNKMVQALTATNAKIEVAAGSLSAVSAGTVICLVKILSGSVTQVFKNFIIDIYGGGAVRPANADLTEAGTKLLSLTRNAGAFSAGVSTNGCNFGNIVGSTLGLAIDPATGLEEVCRGVGLVTGTPTYARLYANAYVTGASSSAVRMDGVIETSGADVNLTTGKSVTAGVYSEVTSVSATMSGV